LKERGEIKKERERERERERRVDIIWCVMIYKNDGTSEPEIEIHHRTGCSLGINLNAAA
jgi:predicted transposase YdaD